MDEQISLIPEETPEITKVKQSRPEYQETELSKYFSAGNVIFGEDGGVYIQARAVKNKEVLLKILIEIHNRYIGDDYTSGV